MSVVTQLIRGLDLVALIGCETTTGSGSSNSNCTPGKVEFCPCPGGGAGTQACTQDGKGYETCDCSGVTGAGTTESGTTDGSATDGGTSEGATTEGATTEGATTEGATTGGTTTEGTTTGGGTTGGGTTGEGCAPQGPQDLKVKTVCHQGNPFWVDVCGETQSGAKICEDEEFCKDADSSCEGAECASCVKPYYDGTWKLTADPDTKDACGIATSTYPTQYLELTVDGTVATAHLEVIGIEVNYTGSVEGKTLLLEGNWQEQSALGTVYHEELLELVFASPSMAEGTHKDAFSMDAGLGVPIDCTTYWTVTAEKQ